MKPISKELISIPTCKITRGLEALLEIGFKVCGVYLTYCLFNFIGEWKFEFNYDSETLFSLLILPSLYILKTSHKIISPMLVRVKVSDYEVESKTGILTRRLDTLQLKTVENIEVVTTIGGKWFNYGTIYLYSYGSLVELPFIINVMNIKSDIENKIKILNTNNS